MAAAMKRSDFGHCVSWIQDEPVRIFVCAGPPKCDRPGKDPCPWCRVILSDDMSDLEGATEH